MDCMRALTLAFPREELVWATTLDIGEDMRGSLLGKADSDGAVLALIDSLRARPEFGRLRLRLAGGQVEADAAFVAGVRARLARHEEAGDVDAQGNLPRAERQEWLRSLSVLSVPTLRPEAFGVFVLEALASGVPVVLPEHGAFPELVRATGGGLLVRPNDPDALAAALGALLRDPDRARALGRAGRAAVLERFSAARAAERLVGLCRDVRAATPTGGRDA